MLRASLLRARLYHHDRVLNPWSLYLHLPQGQALGHNYSPPFFVILAHYCHYHYDNWLNLSISMTARCTIQVNGDVNGFMTWFPDLTNDRVSDTNSVTDDLAVASDSAQCVTGIADHSTVIIDVNISPKLKHRPKRKIVIRNKADHPNIQKSLDDFTHEYFSLNQMKPCFNKNHQHYDPICTTPSYNFQIQPSLVH